MSRLIKKLRNRNKNKKPILPEKIGLWEKPPEVINSIETEYKYQDTYIDIQFRINCFLSLIPFLDIDETRYGKPEIVQKKVEALLNKLLERIEDLKSYITPQHIIVFDTAGIGDVVHSRLIVQHLAKKHRQIAWILPPISHNIYRHDLLVETFPGIYNEYRCHLYPFCQLLSDLINDILIFAYPNNTIYNIPNNVINYLKDNEFTTYPDVWFKSNNIFHNDSLFQLTHYGKLENVPLPIKNKYIVIEPASVTYGIPELNQIQKLINKLKDYNIDSIILGSKNDPMLENAIDARGLELYKTITLIKHSEAFLTVVSGNSLLSVFCKNVNVFEIINNTTSITSCSGYTDFNKFYKTSVETLYHDLTTFLKPKKQKIQEITLFQLAGSGDTLMTTWAPRLLKQKKDIKINFAVKQNHEQFIKNNPYIDNIIIVDDHTTKNIRYMKNPGCFKNELNLWCCANPKQQIRPPENWSLVEESARNIINYFQEDIIEPEDSLLPEIYYTNEEKNQAIEFIEKNAPYVIVETECFSGQFHQSYKSPLTIQNPIINCINPHNMFTSAKEIIPPIQSLNNYSLVVIGLIIQYAQAFFGIGSGLTVMSTEKSLNQPPSIIAYKYGINWLKFLRKYKKFENINIVKPNQLITGILEHYDYSFR